MLEHRPPPVRALGHLVPGHALAGMSGARPAAARDQAGQPRSPCCWVASAHLHPLACRSRAQCSSSTDSPVCLSDHAGPPLLPTVWASCAQVPMGGWVQPHVTGTLAGVPTAGRRPLVFDSSRGERGVCVRLRPWPCDVRCAREPHGRGVGDSGTASAQRCRHAGLGARTNNIHPLS